MLRPLLLACTAAAGWLALAGPTPCDGVPCGPDADSCAPASAPGAQIAPSGEPAIARPSDPPVGGRTAVSCKPQAPIAVSLTQVSGGDAGAVELAFSVEPLIAFEDVSWEVRLPGDVVLLDGEGQGEAAAGRGEVTIGGARVDVPADGAYRALEVAARGTFATVDESGEPILETVVSLAALEFGGAPMPDGLPVTWSTDELGQPQQVIILPSRHTPAK